MQIDGAIISSTTSSSSPRQSYGSMPNSNNNEEKVEESSVVGDDLLLRDEGESSSVLGELTNNNNATIPAIMTTSSRVSLLLNRLVTVRTLSDVIPHHYTTIHLLLFNPQKALPILLLLYTLLLVVWIPCYVAAYTLHLTPLGVIALLLISVCSIGRCILRLLVFPGTNVRIYREIENEFSNYCCTMLDSVSETIDNLIQSTIEHDTKYSSTSSSSSTEEQQLQATYMHTIKYSTKILGTFIDVLHYLSDEGGGSKKMKNDEQQQKKNDFYNRLDKSCKRSFCCDRRTSLLDDGTISSSTLASSSSSSSPPAGCDSTTTDSQLHVRLTKYGNNPLVGDIGNLTKSITPQARNDGRELLTLIIATMNDLSIVGSYIPTSSNNNKIRQFNDNDSAEEEETLEKVVARLRTRIDKIREFVKHIQQLTTTTTSETTDEQLCNEYDPESSNNINSPRIGRSNNITTSITSTTDSSTAQQQQQQQQSTRVMVKSTITAILNMIDPALHKSIFGLDVLRGCLLSRYVGAKQFWVERKNNNSGGRLDVIMIPSSSQCTRDVSRNHDEPNESFLPLSPRKGRDEVVPIVENGSRSSRKRKAVLYCNPNAGLFEVATGMGLTGGNVHDNDNNGDGNDNKEPRCWTEYYIEHGYDVYLFNYAGYGRSHGDNSWNWWNNKTTTTEEFNHGVLGTLKRVLFNTFLAFKPSSESLKLDASAVARHIVDVVGVNELVIHGESIGGMAAAGAARELTTVKPASIQQSNATTASIVLVCDRTFCNLEAVAQRLIGRWTGRAIRLLTPGWSTDVARDFLASNCPKIVAQDSADEIIHDYSSLKSGLAFAGELTKGQTNKVGWMMNPLVEYQIADLDNVSVTDARLSSNKSHRIIKTSSPSWPMDKHISWSEAHHFSACLKRIGKMATVAKRKMQQAEVDDDSNNVEDEGVEVSLTPDEGQRLMHVSQAAKEKNIEAKALMNVWKVLACCDGLCGHHLGHTVKEGFDCTISWLCCTVVFGPQVLIEKAEKRWDTVDVVSRSRDGIDHEIIFNDFDQRPSGYLWDEDAISKYPLPIPVVLSSLKKLLAKQLHAVKEGLLCFVFYCSLFLILHFSVNVFSASILYKHTYIIIQLKQN